MSTTDETQDENKEIELDIDQLDQSTLLSLYRFVCPQSPRATKRRSTAHRQRNPANGTGGGGGNRRKNLDENHESERIEMLEARLRDFEGGGQAAPVQGGERAAESDSSSEEGSESDSQSD